MRRLGPAASGGRRLRCADRRDALGGTDDETDRMGHPLDHYKLIESHMEDCGGDWAQPTLMN
jgi:hypothetical protein